MKSSEMMAEIRDANLTYLMLAQHMIREDSVTASFRLGMTEELAQLVAGLSPAQMLKMASSNMLLCRLRFDDKVLLGMLTGYTKNKPMSETHQAILMAAEPAESVA
jgi:flagellar transcriptional activator FlhD